ncbi:hypothetical protein MFIFM68171_07124 [Madurella fahalii]|uniref:Uncharacterized protein n=1 Tax=Madurella fahalii TaxID=1157608 RepID=A0ABQ0GGM9_9PEZI
MFSILLSLLPAAAAQTPLRPGIAPYVLSDPDFELPVTRETWDAAFAAVNATGSAAIRGKDIRDPFPGANSSDWTYTVAIRDDVPHPSGSGFFTATWLQTVLPPELLSQSTVDGREVQFVDQDESWEICRYVFVGRNTASDEPIGERCGGFWGEECVRGLEEALSQGFDTETESTVMGESKCPPPMTSLIPRGCGLGDAIGAAYGLDADSRLLRRGNFGFMKFAEGEDIHERGNTTAFERAVKRVFLSGHVWGYRTRPDVQNVRIDTEVTCLQANSGPTEDSGDQNGSQSGNENGDGNQGGDGGESAAVSLRVGPLMAVVSLTAVVFGLL